MTGDDAEAVGSHPEQLGLGHGDPAWSFTRSPRIGLDTTAGGARSVRSRAVTLLVVTDPRFLDHDTGAGHPERPERLRAVDAGIAAAGLGDAITQVRAEPAPRAAVEAVHPAELVDALERFCAAGGGAIDADTRVGPSSFEVAMLAAGSGLELVRRLDAGEGTVGFCAVRPPGHHATATRSHGLLPVQQRGGHRRGPGRSGRAGRDRRLRRAPRQRHPGHLLRRPAGALRVAARVAAVPRHRRARRGRGRRRCGHDLNFPLPGGHRRRRVPAGPRRARGPGLERFAPTWLLLSAGFDAHRADPLTGLGLSAGDFADLTARLVAVVPPGRRLVFLEGGYDLEALRDSVAASLAATVGVDVRPEPATGGDTGADRLAAVLNFHRADADG